MIKEENDQNTNNLNENNKNKNGDHNGNENSPKDKDHTNGNTKGNNKINGENHFHDSDEICDMKHRVLSAVSSIPVDGYEMDHKAMTIVDWTSGVKQMHKKAEFQDKEAYDKNKLLDRQRRRKERNDLRLKYAGHHQVGFQVMIDQLKKEELEDKEGYDMNSRAYSSKIVMTSNIKQLELFKQKLKQVENIPIPQTDRGDAQVEMKLEIHGPIETKDHLAITEGHDEHAAHDDKNFGLGDKPWHTYSPTEIMFELVSSSEGLSSQEQAKRLEEYGLNRITPVAQLHWFLKFLLNLIGGFQIFLWLGGILCMIAYGINIEKDDYQTLVLGILCFVVVIGTAVFTSYQEAKSDDVMDSLRALTPSEVYCLRDNTLQKVLVETLVPGDIVHVKSGEKVPADLRVLSNIDLKVNNSSLTGENIDIKLSVEPNSETLYDAHNIARMGANFTCGNGVCIVFATGDNTFFGSIAKSTTEIKRPDSCLKKELKRFIISKI